MFDFDDKNNIESKIIENGFYVIFYTAWLLECNRLHVVLNKRSEAKLRFFEEYVLTNDTFTAATKAFKTHMEKYDNASWNSNLDTVGLF